MMTSQFRRPPATNECAHQRHFFLSALLGVQGAWFWVDDADVLTMDIVDCPQCRSAMVRVVSQGVHHECGVCGGRLEGLVPFQESVAPAAAGEVWRESKNGPRVGRCPFCAGDLRAPSGDAGRAGLAV